MKEKKLVDLTDQELQKKWKDDKFSHQITLATLIIAILFTIFRVFYNGYNTSLLYMPSFVTLLTVVLWINYKSVQKEMNARNLEN